MHGPLRTRDLLPYCRPHDCQIFWSSAPVSSRLLEHASVPVRVITSTEGPQLGRLALPAGVGLLAALAMLAAD